MVHCDPQMSDNIRLPVPTPNATNNVGEVWYRYTFGGEKIGTLGNGIAGNGRIAASTFGMIRLIAGIGQNDNLIIYDYYGNIIWSSFDELNGFAFSSTPMVDIYDRVVACDNQRIFLVNALDRNNIHVEWTSYFPEEFTSSGGIPISPTILKNRTIIIPTKNGPLYAFNVTNGAELANLTFVDNSSSDPVYGIREMNWLDFILIMSNPLDCPYHYNSSSHKVEWNSTVPYGIMPITPIFLEGTIMFMTDDNGTVAAIQTTNGSILAINLIGTPELITDEKIYSTQNSACVQGNRTYVLTGYSAPGWRITNKQYGRLYAVDVNPDAQDPSERLHVAWNYPYHGQSQATPTLINDTIYFDGYNGTTMCLTPPPNRDPQIYAVYTNGTLRWKTPAYNITEFSFSMDPRGGFWYEDSGLKMNGGGGKKLIQRIRDEVLQGKTKHCVAKEMGINESVVRSHTRDLPSLKRGEPYIKGKAVDLLKQLLEVGYVHSTMKNYLALQRLRKILPMIQHTRINYKWIYYLNDKNKIALQSMISLNKSRIISYQELHQVTEVFGADISMTEKESFL
jgi:outer membrane protein assembly factor BamB